MTQPKIIQGGMGVGVSSYQLARAVSQLGHLGTVSGTGAEMVLIRNLQLGDPSGDWRRALSHFPVPEIAEKILDKYFIEGGKAEEESFSGAPMFTINPPRKLIELAVCASFAQVWLAKEGHDGKIAVNLMTKIPLPLVYDIFGCMLAGVDYILIGAGIPMQIPAVLDGLENLRPVVYKPHIIGAVSGEVHQVEFDPASVYSGAASLPRPKFVPIITSHILAISMNKKLPGKIDGFVIEGPAAGGHNAPPRGKTEIGADGQLVYGPRDEPQLKVIRDLGLPFWLAGATISTEGMERVRESGAAGIQAGTIFALCDDSGFEEAYCSQLRRLAYRGELYVYDDALASPTGFPFKIADLPGSLSGADHYGERPRVCNVGYLRHIYLKPDGTVGYRCPSEPVDIYQSKGGDIADTAGRKCLCNALAANIGLGQVQQRTGYHEQPLITLGRDYGFLHDLMQTEDDQYSAADAVHYLESLLGNI